MTSGAKSPTVKFRKCYPKSQLAARLELSRASLHRLVRSPSPVGSHSDGDWVDGTRTTPVFCRTAVNTYVCPLRTFTTVDVG